MDEEEVVLLEEQLASAHADIERLQSELAGLTARRAQHDGEVQELRGRLEASLQEGEEARSQLATRVEEMDRLSRVAAELQAGSLVAAQRYREVVLQREPHLPVDLVSGDSIEEVDASVERARQTVTQVRLHLEQQAQAMRIPAGAPARGSPDASDLSATDKIRLGLSQK